MSIWTDPGDTTPGAPMTAESRENRAVVRVFAVGLILVAYYWVWIWICSTAFRLLGLSLRRDPAIAAGLACGVLWLLRCRSVPHRRALADGLLKLSLRSFLYTALYLVGSTVFHGHITFTRAIWQGAALTTVGAIVACYDRDAARKRDQARLQWIEQWFRWPNRLGE